MKRLIFFLSVVISFFYSINVSATEGCLVGNNFYTSYLGLIRLSNNPEVTGDKKVLNANGTQYSINYSGTEICFTVAANKYSNGSPDRTGDLCFVMSTGTYNSYPASGTPGVKVTNTYPSSNGSLQDFTISCMVTPLPLDDYLPIYVLLIGGVGAIIIRKNLFNQIQIN